MTNTQKACMTRAINRFERAVGEKAFEGTIPFDNDEAILAHEEIDREYARSRQCLVALIERYAL